MPIRQGSAVAKNGSTRDRRRRRHHHRTGAINAVNLEHRLGYVQPDHHNLSHRSPPRSSVAAHAAPSVESRPRHQELTSILLLAWLAAD
jgi:hypothetical protein